MIPAKKNGWPWSPCIRRSGSGTESGDHSEGHEGSLQRDAAQPAVPHVDMNEHGPLISHSHHTQQVDFSKRLIVLALKLEARVRIELTIEVLQTSALPLGYRAGRS